MPEMRWVLVGSRNDWKHLPRNYISNMHTTISQDDQTYVEGVQNLRDLVKYGSTVNRRLVDIYQRYTGEVIEQKSCCSSERKIFFNQFMEWYNSIT